MSFFGFVINSSSPYNEKVPEGADLVLTQAATDKSATEPTTLYVQAEGLNKLIVCTLQWGRTDQARLDLIFESELDVTFSVVGKGDVHVSGYYVEQEGVSEFGSDDEGEEEEEEGEEMAIGSKKGSPTKRLQIAEDKSPAKKPKVEIPKASPKQEKKEEKGVEKPESPKTSKKEEPKKKKHQKRNLKRKKENQRKKKSLLLQRRNPLLKMEAKNQRKRKRKTKAKNEMKIDNS